MDSPANKSSLARMIETAAERYDNTNNATDRQDVRDLEMEDISSLTASTQTHNKCMLLTFWSSLNMKGFVADNSSPATKTRREPEAVSLRHKRAGVRNIINLEPRAS